MVAAKIFGALGLAIIYFIFVGVTLAVEDTDPCQKIAREIDWARVEASRIDSGFEKEKFNCNLTFASDKDRRLKSIEDVFLYIGPLGISVYTDKETFDLRKKFLKGQNNGQLIETSFADGEEAVITQNTLHRTYKWPEEDVFFGSGEVLLSQGKCYADVEIESSGAGAVGETTIPINEYHFNDDGYIDPHPGFDHSLKKELVEEANILGKKLALSLKNTCGGSDVKENSSLNTSNDSLNSSIGDVFNLLNNLPDVFQRILGMFSGTNDLDGYPVEINSSDSEILGITQSSKEELLNRKPEITEQDKVTKKIEQKQETRYRVDKILESDPNTVLIQYPGSSEFVPINEAEEIPAGSIVKTGFDASLLLSIEKIGVLEIFPFTEVVISKEGIENAKKTNQATDEFYLRKGDIEIDIEGGDYQPSLQVETPNVVAGVRGTHFWVSYRDGEKLSTVGVYRGKVNVESKARSKDVLVSSDGNGSPGIVFVKGDSNSGSRFGLWIVIGIVATIIGISMWFLKKRKK